MNEDKIEIKEINWKVTKKLKREKRKKLIIKRQRNRKIEERNNEK